MLLVAVYTYPCVILVYPPLTEDTPRYEQFTAASKARINEISPRHTVQQPEQTEGRSACMRVLQLQSPFPPTTRHPTRHNKNVQIKS